MNGDAEQGELFPRTRDHVAVRQPKLPGMERHGRVIGDRWHPNPDKRFVGGIRITHHPDEDGKGGQVRFTNASGTEHYVGLQPYSYDDAKDVVTKGHLMIPPRLQHLAAEADNSLRAYYQTARIQ